MRIENGGNSLQPHIQTNASKLGSQQPNLASPSRVGSSSTSIDLTSQEDLLSQLVDPTEIREALVNELRFKIQQNEYLTQQAAVATADAILNL